MREFDYTPGMSIQEVENKIILNKGIIFPSKELIGDYLPSLHKRNNGRYYFGGVSWRDDIRLYKEEKYFEVFDDLESAMAYILMKYY